MNNNNSSGNKEIILDEVYDIIPTSFWQTWVGYLAIAGIALASLLFVFLIVKLILWYTQTPANKAKKQLLNLRKNLDKPYLSKTVYTQLILILKQYITSRFQIKFVGLTDTEIIEQLKLADCPKNLIDQLKPVIDHAQVAKFGYSEIEKKSIEHDINGTLNFVEESKDVAHKPAG